MKAKVGGLISRWIRTILLWFALLLAAAAAFSVVAICKGYEDDMEEVLKGIIDMDAFETFAQEYAQPDIGFEKAADNFIYAMRTERNDTEIILYDGRHRIAASGASADGSTPIDDYEQAIDKDNDRHEGYWVGNGDGERKAAYTYARPADENTPLLAVRIITSMRDVVAQCIVLALCIAAIWILCMAIAVISGLFFVRSIVFPIQDIGRVTKEIADGKYNARVTAKPKYDDEVRTLCAEVNRMAADIESTERMKNDFISTITHELRTPLTAMKGFLETIRNKDADEAVKAHGLQVISDETDRLSGLVSELLDLSRFANGRIKLNPEKIDLIAELLDATFLFEARAKKEEKQFRTEISEEDFALINGDSARLRQVFVNIIDNAFKYTPVGGTITVSAHVLPDAGGKAVLEITVKDTGPGVAAKELTRLTEKFYKAGSNVKGSGIGLYVVSEIVKLHGAALELSSVLGQGLAVTTRWPLL
ncbi:MAG: HAMP domain-containing histidine kinase [Oscillospiraceae bacterium]|jgi:signal transduction histidine kinase|nr:HAMP domain-containing histidine kinase [Oscillospiraceae bacterium]